MPLALVRAGFAIAGAYDLLLGVAFLFFGPVIFERGGVPPPNHWAYLQFAALLLMIFGVAFVAVSVDPVRNRNLIAYGILLKLSYVGLVTYYMMTSGCPMLFQPFAAIDAVMLGFFAVALVSPRLQAS